MSDERVPDRPEERVIERVAEAIADGAPVDWGARLEEKPGMEAELERLRFVERVASAHREWSEGVPEGGAPVLFEWGGLRVRERLGEGGFGEVYRAWDPGLERDVALKLRREVGPEGEGDRRWLAEARRLARIRHPNVLAVYGAEVHAGRAGLWTELLRGRTLEDLLAERGPMSAREAALVGVHLCAALAAVHGAGLVHGDLKTRNVMREGGPAEGGAPDHSGRIVLMDFGSARERSPGGAGSSFGTPLAAAPEVLAGEAPTRQSDLYSLGVLLYRLVTGSYPIEGRTVSEVREGTPRPLRDARPDLSLDFVQVVGHALARRPQDRFGSAADMERALVATLAPAAAGAPRRRATMGAALAAVAVAAAMVGLATLGLWAGRGSAPRTVKLVPEASGPTDDPRTAVPGPAVPTTPPAARAASAPDVEARLFAADAAGARSLDRGGQVAPGDRLYLEFEGREPLHVYVLDEDELGAVVTLFPVAGSDLENPLPPGTHRLPGHRGSVDLDWQVTSAGGRETFLILASRQPLSAIEEQVARLPAARRGETVTYPTVPPDALARLRSVSGLAPREAAPPAGSGALRETARRLTGTPSLWMRLVTVDNPVP